MSKGSKVTSLMIAIVVGGLVGAVVGAIGAVNIVIFGGITDGYEADLAQIFHENLFVGVAAIGALLAGPIAGVVVALRTRSDRKR